MDGVASGIRYGDPSFPRNKNDGVRTCHGPLITNSYRRTSFFKDHYFFRVVMFVERNHCPRLQNLVTDVKVFGASVLFVNLDEELRNGTRTCWPPRAAQAALPITFLQNQWCGKLLRLRGRLS